MTKRLFVWAVFLLVLWLVYRGAAAFRNPWTVPIPAPAVLSVLPEQPGGCSKAKGCL